MFTIQCMNLKSERNNPAFKPWPNILHNQLDEPQYKVHGGSTY